jgi:isopenicillin-N epimerase
MPLSRRDFSRLLAVGGAAPFLPAPAFRRETERPRDLAPRPAPSSPTEAYWEDLRTKFSLVEGLAFINASNLCPTPFVVRDALERETHRLDGDPSSATKNILATQREATRRALATMLGATPEEVVIVRNTSEANNLVSSGLQLGAADEIITFADNHPSNLAAWRDKAKRFGFTVTTLPTPTPHPGPEYYVEAVTKAITARTRLVAFTHVTNTVGDLFPAEAICRVARERGVLSLLDGAQTFGVLAVNLGQVKPDFYSGSAHKFPCGPKETGVLYINSAVHDRIHPSVVGVYPGAVGISRTMEATGQRDEAAMAALGTAIEFQRTVGHAAIETRGRELATFLMQELGRLPGVHLYTDPRPTHSTTVVTLRPGSLDPRKLAATLYEKDRVAVTARAGTDRPGIRLSPHLFNTMAELERVVTALRGYIARGLA